MRAVFSIFVASLILLWSPHASAQEAADWSGFSFEIAAGASSDGGHTAASATYMFPLGNSSWLIGPTLRLSGYSETTNIPFPKGRKGDPSSALLDLVPLGTETIHDHQLSLGLRVASVASSGNWLAYGEIGAAKFGVTTTKQFVNFNKLVGDTSFDTDAGFYGAVGGDVCVSQRCRATVTGSLQYYDVTNSFTVNVGVGLHF